MILVVGGTGVLGREVTQRLLAEGESVRVLTRTPANAGDLRTAGAEVVAGDLTDPASLTGACRGVQQLVAAAHSLLGKGRYDSAAVDGAGNRALIDAAKAAGVQHVVFVSIMGAAPGHPVDFWRTKFAAEEYLKASGLGYTIICPSAFMEWHAHEFNGKGILAKGKTTLLGKGTKSRNLVAARDVARFVVLALSDPALRDRTIEVGGPENLTNEEVAAVYGAAAGVTPKVRHVPPVVLKGASAALKPFQPGVSRILFVGSLPDDAYDERFDPTPLLAEFPMELTTLGAFVGERVAERRGG